MIIFNSCIFQSVVFSDPQCSFATSCARRTLELNETDSPVILPCDNSTLINTIDMTGSYSYCHGELLLVNQGIGYYSLEFNFTYNGATICCYNHNQDACGVCYDLIVYCKYMYMHCVLYFTNL